MSWTYILFSPSLNRYDIGQTGNIRTRLRFHINGSTAYTQQAKDWMLVFLQQTSTRAAAMHLERKTPGICLTNTARAHNLKDSHYR